MGRRKATADIRPTLAGLSSTIDAAVSPVESDLAVRQRALMGIGLGMVPVTDRNVSMAAGNVSASGDRECFSSYGHKIRRSFGAIRLVYANYHGGPNESVTAEVTVKASVDHPVDAYGATMDSSPIQVTFAGASTVAIPYGDVVVSDPIILTGHKGQIVYTNTYTTAAAQFAVGENTIPANIGLPNLYEGSERGATATDRTSGGGTRPTGYLAGFGPAAVIGSPVDDRGLLPVSIFGAGDSIMQASADGPYNNGFLVRSARAAELPYINAGHQSEKFSQVRPDGTSTYGGDYTQRLPLAGLAATWVCAYGRNDLDQAIATIQANALAFWRMLAAVSGRGYQATLVPVTSSSDKFTTVDGQTPDGTMNPTRLTFNAWVRDGAPISATNGAAVATGTVGAIRAGEAGHPLSGYVETADTVESARDSGKWKAPYKTFSDGALTASSKSITSATASFTQDDVGQSILVIDGGGAGVDLLGEITIVESATLARWERAGGAASTTTGITAYIGVMTSDGTHPHSGGHKDMSAAISAADL